MMILSRMAHFESRSGIQVFHLLYRAMPTGVASLHETRLPTLSNLMKNIPTEEGIDEELTEGWADLHTSLANLDPDLQQFGKPKARHWVIKVSW